MLQWQSDLNTKQQPPQGTASAAWQAQPPNSSGPEAKKSKPASTSEGSDGWQGLLVGLGPGRRIFLTLSVSSRWWSYKSCSSGMSSGTFPNFAGPPEGALISQFCSVAAGVNCLWRSEIPCFLLSLPTKRKNTNPWTSLGDCLETVDLEVLSACCLKETHNPTNILIIIHELSLFS